MENENMEPDLGKSDNSSMPETQATKESSSQSLWGELAEDDKTIISNKGFKTPADLIKSYRELEKSSSNKFSVPKDDDAESWRKLYQKLGLPEDTSGYDLEISDVDKAYADDFKKICLNTGLNNKQAAGIYNWYRENQNKVTELFNQKSQAEQNEVKELWGTDFDKNSAIMKHGFRVLGLSQEFLENIEVAIGSKNFMLLGKHIGDMVSEDAAKGLRSTSATQVMSTEEYFKEIFAQAGK